MTYIPGAEHLDARIISNNVTGNEICKHCNGSPLRPFGWVLIDDPTSHGWMAPCPMCTQGRSREKIQWNDKYWGTIFNVSEVTWNNGMTVKHQRSCSSQNCYQPAVGTLCNHHFKHGKHYKPNYTEIRSAIRSIRTAS